jgi:hypothetical protein
MLEIEPAKKFPRLMGGQFPSLMSFQSKKLYNGLTLPAVTSAQRCNENERTCAFRCVPILPSHFQKMSNSPAKTRLLRPLRLRPPFRCKSSNPYTRKICNETCRAVGDEVTRTLIPFCSLGSSWLKIQYAAPHLSDPSFP